MLAQKDTVRSALLHCAWSSPFFSERWEGEASDLRSLNRGVSSAEEIPCRGAACSGQLASTRARVQMGTLLA